MSSRIIAKFLLKLPELLLKRANEFQYESLPTLSNQVDKKFKTFLQLLVFQLISEDRFRALDKIKTIGSTYMAAVGLIPEYKILDDNEDAGLSAVHYVAQVIVVKIGHLKLQ